MPTYTDDQVRSILKEKLLSGEITREQASAKMAKHRSMQPSDLVGIEGNMISRDVPSTALPAVGAAQDVQGTLQRADFTAGQQVENFTGLPVSGAIDAVGDFASDVGETISNLPGQALDIVQGIPEMVMGTERAVASTEALPPVNEMPEMSGLQALFNKAPVTVGASTLFTSNDETAQIFKANFPDNPTRQDEKGNWIFTSLQDNKEYALKPGFGPYDAGRVLGGIGVGRLIALAAPIVTAVLGEGALATTAGIALTESIAETINQGIQKGAGGEFDTGDIALAGAIPSVLSGVGAGARQLRGKTPPVVKPPAVKPDVPKVPVVDEVSIVSTKGKGKETISAKSEFGNVTGTIKGDGLHITESIIDEAERGKGHGVQVYTNLIDDAFDKGVKVFSDETVDPGAVRVYESLKRKGYEIIDNRQGTLKDGTAWAKDKPVFEVKPKVATEAFEEVAEEVTEKELKDVASNLRKAGRQEDISKLTSIEDAAADPQLIADAKLLGIEDYIQPDHISTSGAFRQISQALKSLTGSKAKSAETAGLIKVGERAQRWLSDYGAGSVDEASSSVAKKMEEIIDKIRVKEGKAFDEVAAGVPWETEIIPANTKTYLDDRVNKVGVKKLKPIEKDAYNAIYDKKKLMNVAILEDLRSDAGAKMGKTADKGDAETGIAKKMYGLLAEDLFSVADDFGMKKQKKIANLYTVAKKGIDKDMQALFGKKLNSTFGLGKAVKGLGADKAKEFVEFIKKVPRSMRPEVLASGIDSVFGKALKGGEVDLNFNTFSRWMQKIEKSSIANNALMSNLPQGSAKELKALARISKGINLTSQEFINTGKIDQAKEYILNSAGFVGKVMEKTKDSTIPAAIGVVTYGATGSGTAATAVAGAVKMAMENGKEGVIDSMQTFMSAPAYKKASMEIASGELTDRTKAQLLKSSAWRTFQKTLFKVGFSPVTGPLSAVKGAAKSKFAQRNIDFSPAKDAEVWLLSALRASRQHTNKDKEEK